MNQISKISRNYFLTDGSNLICVLLIGARISEKCKKSENSSKNALRKTSLSAISAIQKRPESLKVTCLSLYDFLEGKIAFRGSNSAQWLSWLITWMSQKSVSDWTVLSSGTIDTLSHLLIHQKRENSRTFLVFACFRPKNKQNNYFRE